MIIRLLHLGVEIFFNFPSNLPPDVVLLFLSLLVPVLDGHVLFEASLLDANQILELLLDLPDFVDSAFRVLVIGHWLKKLALATLVW